MNKQELREKIKEKRKNLNIEQISSQVIKNIRKLPQYLNAKNIAIFYPLKNEINLLPLLDDSKNFYLPKIKDQNLELCPYKKGDELILSCFKTKEPKSNSVEKNKIDLIFVPAMCADKNNYRLGYGKGFYDRLLKNYTGIKIVPLASEFLFENIPHDSNDVKVDLIITENY